MYKEKNKRAEAYEENKKHYYILISFVVTNFGRFPCHTRGRSDHFSWRIDHFFWRIDRFSRRVDEQITEVDFVIQQFIQGARHMKC
uniref:Uncharacterized protein n=1 Tax=Romanomermis culicivorax TaxID=13658 RepID=A0A915HKK1_ROMCU